MLPFLCSDYDEVLTVGEIGPSLDREADRLPVNYDE